MSYCIQAARLYSTTQSVSSSSNFGLYQLVGGAALGASIVVLATTASASDALHPIAMPFNHKGYMERFDTARYGEFIYSRAFSGLSIFVRVNALTSLRNFQPPCVYVTVHGFKVVVGFAYISQIIMY